MHTPTHRRPWNYLTPSVSRAGRRLTVLALVVLLIPTLGPECQEQEPNDATNSANLIKPGEYFFGEIDTTVGDVVDFLKTENASVGDLVFAYTDSQVSSVSTDSRLQVIANDGVTVIETDDDDGPPAASASSAVVAGAIVPQDGDVFFRVNEGGDDQTLGIYRLYQAIVKPNDFTAESESNDTSAVADLVTGTVVRGDVPQSGTNHDVDFFKFTVTSLQSRIVVIMDDNPDDIAPHTDTELDIIGPDGTTVLASGDNNGDGDGNAAGAVFAANPGIYFVRVTDGDDLTNNHTDYRFVVLVNGVAYRDSDGDGVPNPDDNCPNNSNPLQEDGDGDGIGDVCDPCPASVLKQSAGDCGCNQPDIDVDGDGDIDCGLNDPARRMLERVGLLLVTDIDHKRVMAFDPKDGDLVDANFIPADPTHLINPICAILGPDNNSILVSDATINLIQRYDLDGNFLGTFAPVGGHDASILQQPTGITLQPNGNLLVCIQGGGNANAIAEFDTSGNFVGNFIANGAGGLALPEDVLIRSNGHVLVVGSGSQAVHEYNATGAYIPPNFTDVNDEPKQIIEAKDSNVWLACRSVGLRGYLEFDSTGTLLDQHSPIGLAGFFGLGELGNGNLLISTEARVATGGNDGLIGGGVFVMTKTGAVLGSRFLGAKCGYIEFVRQDKDKDGVGDALDNCPNAANTNQQDADGDGAGDACDACPNDSHKTQVGACGCGVLDTDTDGDGTANCDDGCPNDADKTAAGVCGCGNVDTDSDGDGTADCNDSCPDDASKTAPGACGCGVADEDSDGDGILDCEDNCIDTANADQADVDGNGVGNACEEGPVVEENPCGDCGAGAMSMSVMMAPMLLYGRMRRGRRIR